MKANNLDRKNKSTTHIADQILIQALETCAQELSLGGLEVVTEQLRRGQDPACAHMCCILARQVARALGALDARVRAVYAGDTPHTNGSRPRSSHPGIPPIDLVIWRQQKTATFESLVDDLGRALSQRVRDTFGAQAPPTLLDVQVIEDADLERHFGSGRRKNASTRLASYLLRAHSEPVDVVYAHG